MTNQEEYIKRTNEVRIKKFEQLVVCGILPQGIDSNLIVWQKTTHRLSLSKVQHYHFHVFSSIRSITFIRIQSRTTGITRRAEMTGYMDSHNVNIKDSGRLIHHVAFKFDELINDEEHFLKVYIDI